MVESRKEGQRSGKIEKLLSSLREEVIGIAVGRALGVWVVQEVLNANEDLLDSNSRLPVPVLIQNGEAHCPRRVDVRVKEWRHELA